MELAASLEPLFSPASPFFAPPDINDLIRIWQSEYDDRDDDNVSQTSWTSSLVNPCNKVSRYSSRIQAKWSIDGCTGLGRQLFALPIFMLPDLPVKRIDVLIPCQSRHPNALRRELGSSYLYGMSGRSINQLGISQYITHLLDHWATNQPYFEDIYRSLPFGSIILVDRIMPNIEDVKVRFIPNTHFAQNLMTVQRLQDMWELPEDAWPPMIHLEALRLDTQLNGNVSIVRIPNLHGLKHFVFKTNLRDIKYIYHELKLLLKMAPHDNIVARPSYVVTLVEPSTPPVRVVGFILEYYAHGNLRDVLDSGMVLIRKQRLDWSVKILKALIHTLDGPAQFYSDLKPDNIVFSRPSDGVILIDFEQAGNWDTFRAPEIFYTDWMEKLSHLEVVPKQQRTRYKALVDRNIHNPVPKEEMYSNPANGCYELWTSLSPRERESAMIYSFGKVLWCIFEGCSHTRNSSDEKYDTPVSIEFPHFTTTPSSIQDLIRKCTYGAPDWSSEEVIRVVREGSRFVLMTGLRTKSYPAVSPKEVAEASQKLWESRIQRMEAYVEAKTRWAEGLHDQDDELLLGFTLRPRLTEVLNILQEEIEREG